MISQHFSADLNGDNCKLSSVGKQNNLCLCIPPNEFTLTPSNDVYQTFIPLERQYKTNVWPMNDFHVYGKPYI